MDLLFRGDTAGTTLGVYMPSVRVNLSTTKRGPDELSARFSDNVGTDDTVIFSGQLNTGLCGGHGSGSESFAFEIDASSKLFFYNPAAGNLLFDVRVFQGNTNTLGMIPIVFDAVNVTNDSVSRVWSADVNAITGSVDTIGLPTLIFFWANPMLTVIKETDSVALTWRIPGFLPAPFQTVLESSDSLGSGAQWQAVTNGIVTSNFVSTFSVPLDATGAAAYFRLVSTTPP